MWRDLGRPFMADSRGSLCSPKAGFGRIRLLQRRATYGLSCELTQPARTAVHRSERNIRTVWFRGTVDVAQRRARRAEISEADVEHRRCRPTRKNCRPATAQRTVSCAIDPKRTSSILVRASNCQCCLARLQVTRSGQAVRADHSLASNEEAAERRGRDTANTVSVLSDRASISPPCALAISRAM